MSPNLKAIPLIVLGGLLNAAAQICLKKGLQAAGGMQLAVRPLVRLMLVSPTAMVVPATLSM